MSDNAKGASATAVCAASLKAYEAPELVEYGTLRDLTLAVATTTANADGGTGQTNKTA
jgi:hypothetical protein